MRVCVCFPFSVLKTSQLQDRGSSLGKHCQLFMDQKTSLGWKSLLIAWAGVSHLKNAQIPGSLPHIPSLRNPPCSLGDVG